MSRITKLFFMTFAGICVFIPLAMRGHGRAAGIFFLAWMAMEFVIFLRMKPFPADFAPLRKAGQNRSAKRARFAGYFWAAAAVLGLCLFDYKVSLWWPIIPGLAFSGSMTWLSFRSAKRIEEMPAEEWERRYRK